MRCAQSDPGTANASGQGHSVPCARRGCMSDASLNTSALGWSTHSLIEWYDRYNIFRNCIGHDWTSNISKGGGGGGGGSCLTANY